MIKTLYKRYVTIIFFSLFLVLVTVIGAINISNYIYTTSEEQTQLNDLVSNYSKMLTGFNNSPFQNDGVFNRFDGMVDGDMPDFLDKWPFREKNDSLQLEKNLYFAVETDLLGSVENVFKNNISNLSDSDVEQCVVDALGTAKASGVIGKYRFTTANVGDSHRLFVFLDCSQKSEFLRSLLLTSALIGLIAFAVIFLIAVFLSQRIIRPLEEGINKQKQFITDASHELKTPIAIISANTDVLSLTGVENQWVDSIKKQTTRLSALVQELVSMSRIDEGLTGNEFVDIDFSKLVCDAAEPFISLSEIEDKHYSLNIDEDISIRGNETMLKKLVSILLDNAFKYSTDEGNIEISLHKDNKQLVLQVVNDVDNPEYIDVGKIFDRFYRSDDSRNSDNGGTGIGLSMAKAIVESHSGKISAAIKNNTVICFKVILKV